jgi:DNA-binding NarL/FixJ family response regulator
MVLDADPESLASHFRLLSDRGFRVATYSSPGPAFDYAASERPDAILTALRFPECDGMTAVRRLREASPRSRILVRVSQNERSSAGEAARAGAEVLVSGATGSEEILRRIEDAVGELPLSSDR